MNSNSTIIVCNICMCTEASYKYVWCSDYCFPLELTIVNNSVFLHPWLLVGELALRFFCCWFVDQYTVLVSRLSGNSFGEHSAAFTCDCNLLSVNGGRWPQIYLVSPDQLCNTDHSYSLTRKIPVGRYFSHYFDSMHLVNIQCDN